MNKFIGFGRLTKDVELRYSQGENQTAIARFSVAIDRIGDNQTADFISCVAFGKNAEKVQKYFAKGSKILVEAHVQTGSYQKDGKTIYTTDFVIDHWEFGESRSNTSVAAGLAKINTDVEVEDEGFTNIPEGIDEDLPFAKLER